LLSLFFVVQTSKDKQRERHKGVLRERKGEEEEEDRDAGRRGSQSPACGG